MAFKKKINAPAVASSGILVEFKLLLFRGSPDTISDFWKLGQSYRNSPFLLSCCTIVQATLCTRYSTPESALRWGANIIV